MLCVGGLHAQSWDENTSIFMLVCLCPISVACQYAVLVVMLEILRDLSLADMTETAHPMM
jgi:hypothetical protein